MVDFLTNSPDCFRVYQLSPPKLRMKTSICSLEIIPDKDFIHVNDTISPYILSVKS